MMTDPSPARSGVRFGRFIVTISDLRGEKVSNDHKIVHFVRHAQGHQNDIIYNIFTYLSTDLGHHNVAGSIDYRNYLKEEFFDSSLSPLGEEQCREVAANESIQNNVLNSKLVLVSPLRRTLQTALQCFPTFVNKIPFKALESIREQSGLHPCDRRNSIKDQASMFPLVDFNEIFNDEDPIYGLYPGAREPEEDVMARALKAIEYIITREEKEIIVVSHSSYLSKLLQTFYIHKQFQNAEVASYVIHSSTVEE